MMEFLIENPAELANVDLNGDFVEDDVADGQIFLLTDTPAEKTYILPINLQVVPIAVTTSEAPKKKQTKKRALPPLYNCQNCKYTTSLRKCFRRHQEKHWIVKKNVNKSGEKNGIAQNESEGSIEYKCPHCSYYTSNVRSLRIHMNIHSNENAYSCLDCKFKGKNLEELIIHHKRSKTLSCKYCTFTTHNNDFYRAHVDKNHAAKWFGCTHCNFAAADRNYVITHIKERHSKALRFNPVKMEPDPEQQPDQQPDQQPGQLPDQLLQT